MTGIMMTHLIKCNRQSKAFSSNKPNLALDHCSLLPNWYQSTLPAPSTRLPQPKSITLHSRNSKTAPGCFSVIARAAAPISSTVPNFWNGCLRVSVGLFARALLWCRLWPSSGLGGAWPGNPPTYGGVRPDSGLPWWLWAAGWRWWANP